MERIEPACDEEHHYKIILCARRLIDQRRHRDETQAGPQRKTFRVPFSSQLVYDDEEPDQCKKTGNRFAKARFHKRVMHGIKYPWEDDLPLREPASITPESSCIRDDQAA